MPNLRSRDVWQQEHQAQVRRDKVQGFLLLWLQAPHYDPWAQVRLSKADSRGTVGQCCGRGHCQAGQQSQVCCHDAGKNQHEGGHCRH